jgi:hypothetical protein
LAKLCQSSIFLEIDQSEKRIACDGISDWLISKNSSPQTARPNDPKLGRKHLWAVLYKVYSFRSNSINKHGRHRRFKLTNQKKELPVMAMFVNRLGQNEQSL